MSGGTEQSQPVEPQPVEPQPVEPQPVEPQHVEPGPAEPGSGDLETQVGRWRAYLHRRRAISTLDVEELEDHLRDQVADLARVGLSEDEAFLVAIKRMGALDQVSREYAREHSERLWHQLVLTDGDPESAGLPGREPVVVLGLAAAAALAVKLPGLVWPDPIEATFYVTNLSLLVLPFLAGYFAWKRGIDRGRAVRLLVLPFVLMAVVTNAFPFSATGDLRAGDAPIAATQWLLAIHLPVLAWFTVGVAYLGGDLLRHRPRMDFVRFTGEWAVYYTLIALGGGALCALTVASFDQVGVDASRIVEDWVVPCGAAGAVLVAAWLVEAKQEVVENLAPVLTRLFTPLTTLLLLTLLGTVLTAGNVVEVDRDLLIVADAILVLVFGQLLYATSARDPQAPPGLFDRLQVVLVLSALALDLLMLIAMLGRIAEFGASPNKVAALGLNLVLLVNLVWSAQLGIGHLRGRERAGALADWQTRYLPCFAAWAAFIVVVFPPVFGFS